MITVCSINACRITHITTHRLHDLLENLFHVRGEGHLQRVTLQGELHRVLNICREGSCMQIFERAEQTKLMLLRNIDRMGGWEGSSYLVEGRLG